MNKYSLALNFHENTKTIEINNRYDPRIVYKTYPNTKAIPLEKNDINKASVLDDIFLQTLLSRQSTRAFTEDNIDLHTLSSLLTLSCGLKDATAGTIFRTYASAGGRYPIEVYVVNMSPGEIEQGIYHYNIYDNSLELIKSGDYSKKFRNFYKNQDSAIVTDYPFLILFSVVFERTMQKYGERGYRFALIDAGHMSQNLYLVATYLKLGIVAFGAGTDSDDKLDDVLGLTHNEENFFYAFAIGHPQ